MTTFSWKSSESFISSCLILFNLTSFWFVFSLRGRNSFPFRRKLLRIMREDFAFEEKDDRARGNKIKSNIHIGEFWILDDGPLSVGTSRRIDKLAAFLLNLRKKGQEKHECLHVLPRYWLQSQYYWCRETVNWTWELRSKYSLHLWGYIFQKISWCGKTPVYILYMTSIHTKSVARYR